MKGLKSLFLPNLSNMYAAPPYEKIVDKINKVPAIIVSPAQIIAISSD